jgi:FkbM family methyltransferase
MKILWHSVAPWVGTGYGQQTATFTPRIQALGHDVAISAYYGLSGSRLNWNGIPCYPSYEVNYGNDVIVTHALDHFDVVGKPFREAASSGLILTLTDVWVLTAPLLTDMAVACWAPVDHLELPGITRRWFEKSGAQPIAMSRFGERVMTDAGLSPLYVPHGIDTSTFRPGDKAEARERTGLPGDAFVVAIVSANVGKDGNRKAFAEQITAFAELRRRHSDAMLVLHTDVANQAGNNLRRLLDRLPEGSYIYTDQYAYRRGIPPDVIADIYRSADVLSNCTWGEGFGVPVVEAQACGTPVVVTDATAMVELCGAGWKIPYTPLWHEMQDAWAAVPHIPSIIDAYEEAYDHAADLHDDAAAFGASYDADFVTDTYWQPTLKRLAEMLDQRMEDAHKPPRRSAPNVIEADGLLWIDRGKGTEDYLGPSAHEAELEPHLVNLVPEDGIVLEVGAHVGHWTLRLADHAALILAVEANPETATVLRRNLVINDITNVEIIPVAAWDENTTLRLEDPNKRNAGGSTRTLPSTEGDATVPAAPLDDVITDLPRLDLVKLDVEGADIHALRGMAKLLREHRPVLFIECHDYCGYYTRAELEETLTDLGYTWEVAHTYASTWSPTGTLPDPVDADYLRCLPVGNIDERLVTIARDAVTNHGASQLPDELADALALVAGTDPKVIVELGCDVGGTLYTWRQGCPDATVLGITLMDNSYATGGTDGSLDTHGATVHLGDSHDPESRRWLVEALAERPIDVLVLDGDHSSGGIYADLGDYGTLVRPGGLILIHDIASRGDARAEVYEVWPQLAARYRTTEINSPVAHYGWGVIHVGPAGWPTENVGWVDGGHWEAEPDQDDP